MRAAGPAGRVTAALAAVLVLAGCGSAAQSSAPVPSGPPTSELRVGLLDYRLAVSGGTLRPGSVTITATNAGGTGHDLRLRQGNRVLAATSVLAPGGSETLRVDVQPGEPVRLDCTVGGHAEAGMHATLTVAE
ncbi:MAG: hypothetical protein WD794_09400 [Mycobacteriales bacterium]